MQRLGLHHVLAWILVGVPCLLAQPAPTLALTHANVLPMTSDTVLVDHTLLIQGDRIVALGPSHEIAIPVGATIYDAKGQYLMPGLIDAHVHFFPNEWPTFEESRLAYLRHGVMTVFNLWAPGNDVYYLTIRDRSQTAGLWPTVYTTGEALKTQRFASPDEAEAEVRKQVDAGIDMIKVYEPNRPETFARIHAVAKTLGIATVGHVPDALGTPAVLRTGQMIAHMSELYSGWPDISRTGFAELADQVKASGNVVQTTLVVSSRRAQQLAGFLHERDVPLLLGTDTGVTGIHPGKAVHRELQLLVQSGLTPFEALATATLHPSQTFKAFDQFGIIAPGYRADLLILDRHPFEPSLQLAIKSVVVRGHLHHVDQL